MFLSKTETRQFGMSRYNVRNNLELKREKISYKNNKIIIIIIIITETNGVSVSYSPVQTSINFRL